MGTLTLLGSKYTCEMGKNKQKKQNNATEPPQAPVTDNTKAVRVNVEAEPNGKSDIDKVLDDWLNSCDEEIPEESNLVKVEVKSTDETQGSKKAHKESGKKDEDKETVPDDPQSQPSMSQEPKPSTEAADAWIDDDNVGFSMKDEDDAVIVTKVEKQSKEQKKEEVKKNTEKPKVSSPKPEPK